MKLTPRGREALLLGLLAALPALAHAPALVEGRLLGPGDGAQLHYPLRVAVWRSLRAGELPAWNPWIFGGTPLLAAYRPGALYPPMWPLALLPDFPAFQVLVLGSLAAAGMLCFVYLRRLGADLPGAYVSGLCFALGPYLTGHLGDTATLVAAPTLPLLLLAAEAFCRKASPGRGAGLAAATALLLLAGSPEAARAGAALLAGRLLIGHLFPGRSRPPSVAASAWSVAAGLALAAPQLVPTLIAAREAGRQVTGLASDQTPLPGITGLILRYVSHTPAPSLALAALPLVLTETPVRVLGAALGLCLGLQYGRGPLSAPGALALVFDLTLAILAGLSLSAQWEVRREGLGARLRAYFLFSCLASAAALSVSAAALGPLQQTLAGAVGVLALALVLYFALAASADPVQAHLWLLPLSIAFLLQPHGRGVWESAPRRDALERGTPTREAIEHALGTRHAEPTLTLARAWPSAEALDLAFGNLGALTGRRSAGGYDPMVPLRARMVLDGMSVGGILPGAFFRSDPRRLELLGVRFLQVPTTALLAPPDAQGLGDVLDLRLAPGAARFFPLPISAATEVRLATLMSDAVRLEQDRPVASVALRTVTGHRLPLVLRAGRETGEWAWERPDVRASVAHALPPVLDSWRDPAGFMGHAYLGVLPLQGRYTVDGLWIERLPGPGQLTLSRLALHDAPSGRALPVSLTSAFVSDVARFREAAATPRVRLLELPGAAGLARVVDTLRTFPDDGAVLRALRQGALDPRREAAATAREAQGIAFPQQARASRGEVRRAEAGRIEAQAEGPGLLVLAFSWDPGWSATLDGAPAPILRVNHVQIGVCLPPGFHHVRLRYAPRGLGAGLALAGLAAVSLAVPAWRGRAGPAV